MGILGLLMYPRSLGWHDLVFYDGEVQTGIVHTWSESGWKMSDGRSHEPRTWQLPPMSPWWVATVARVDRRARPTLNDT